MEAIRIQEQNPARSEPVQGIARVVGRAGESWHLDLQGQRRIAVRARSCLLEPRLEDRVLVLLADDECWVLAVLDRSDCALSRLTFPGNVELEMEHGGLSVRAKKAVSLSSQESFGISAPLYSLCANAAEHFVQGVSWVGKRLVSTFDSIRMLSRSQESITTHRREHSANSIRSVEQVDRLTCGQLDYRVDGNFAVQGKNVIAKGRELIKIDGRQIQLG